MFECFQTFVFSLFRSSEYIEPLYQEYYGTPVADEARTEDDSLEVTCRFCFSAECGCEPYGSCTCRRHWCEGPQYSILIPWLPPCSHVTAFTLSVFLFSKQSGLTLVATVVAVVVIHHGQHQTHDPDPPKKSERNTLIMAHKNDTDHVTTPVEHR